MSRKATLRVAKIKIFECAYVAEVLIDSGSALSNILTKALKDIQCNEPVHAIRLKGIGNCSAYVKYWDELSFQDKFFLTYLRRFRNEGRRDFWR